MPREKIADYLEITPLTRRNLDGRVYERSEEVERQIAAALALEPEELLARALERDWSARDYVQEETLAAIFRAAHRASLRARRDGLANGRVTTLQCLIEGLAAVLEERCANAARRRGLGPLPPDRMAEAVQEVSLELFELLLEPEGSDRGDFLQVRFGVVLKRLAIAAYNRQVAEMERSRNTVPLGNGEPGDDDGNASEEVDVAEPSIPADELLVLREGLSQLEEPYRTAFVLRYYYRWPVEDADLSVPTISHYFGKTSRTIRNWLRRAEQTLQEWRREQLP